MKRGKDLTIDLIDLIAYVLRRWHTILIMTLVFAVIVGGYKYVSFSQASADQYSEENRERLAAKLTDTEKNEIENLFNRYLAYRNSISYSESYLGPNKLPCLITQYIVSSDQHDVISSFTGQALGANEYKKIADVFGEGTDASRISELVSVSNGSAEQNGVSIDLKNSSSIILGSINNNYKWILNLTVYAFSEAQCESVMSIIEEAVQNQFQALSNAGLDISIVRIGTNYTESASKWLADRQRTMISETSSLKAEYDKFEKETLSNNLSSSEKAYFTFLKNRYEEKKTESHVFRAVVLGAAFGFAATIFILLLLYLFSNRIKNKEDYLYEVDTDNILGIIYSTIHRKGFVNKTVNRIINKVFFDMDKDYNTPEKTKVLAKRVSSMCKINEITELYVVDDTTQTTANELLGIFVGTLSQDGINVVCGKPLKNSEDYDLFEQSKTVMYWGGLYNSKKESLSDYTRLFTETNSKVLGSILYNEL